MPRRAQSDDDNVGYIHGNRTRIVQLTSTVDPSSRLTSRDWITWLADATVSTTHFRRRHAACLSAHFFGHLASLPQLSGPFNVSKFSTTATFYCWIDWYRTMQWWVQIFVVKHRYPVAARPYQFLLVWSFISFEQKGMSQIIISQRRAHSCPHFETSFSDIGSFDCERFHLFIVENTTNFESFANRVGRRASRTRIR